MFIKFRFKNYSCFESWEEIDLIDYNHYHMKTLPAKIVNICGMVSSGKSSIVYLIDIAIKYLKRFYIYDSNNLFNNISTKFNPFLFNTKENLDSVSNEIEKTINLEDVCLELYFANDSFIYKYELKFNNNYPSIESLSYKLNNNGQGLEGTDWINLYYKKNLTYELINYEETCVFKIDINEIELEIKNKPSLTHLNQKNSLLNYIKTISKSVVIESFFDILDRITIFNDQFYDGGIFKDFFIDKKYLINNKERFLNAFHDMKINIVDFSIDNNKIINGFYLMIGKELNQKTIYLNSRFESNSTIRLFYLLYYIFRSIDNNEIVIIDDLDKQLSINEINYLLSLVNLQKNNKNNCQLLFTINDGYRNDLLGISQSNIDIIKNKSTSKIKRIV